MSAAEVLCVVVAGLVFLVRLACLLVQAHEDAEAARVHQQRQANR